VRAQAARVSGVVAGGGENRALVLENAAGEGYTRIVLYNHSSAPVYRAIVSLVFVQGAGPRTGQELNSSQRLALQRYLTTIPPGESEVQVSAAWAGMMASPGVEIAFTDQAGISWIRYSDGKLGQLAQTPASYYHLERGEVLTWGAVRPVEASRTTR
jgi:hypothetical protein